MVFSELLLKVPFEVGCFIKNNILRKKEIYFYVDNILDYMIFKNIHKYMDNIKFIAKNTTVKNKLQKYGVNAEPYPVFPKVIIMARHSLHKFPSKQIISIGLRHGAYHFKDFISSKKYNRFDLFLLTSEREVEEARSKGIETAISGGFPKIDDLFDAEIIE
jgi:hypothetical protein